MRKKAALYTLDSIVGLLLTVIIVASANNYMSRSAYNRILLAQSQEIGGDAVTLLQQIGYIDSYYNENGYFFNGSVMDKARGNHGKLYGNATLVSDYNDYYDHRLKFNGTYGYVNLTNSSDLQFRYDENYAISLWFKTASEGVILSRGDVSHTNNFYLNIYNGLLYFHVGNYNIQTSVPVNNYTWVHVVAMVENTPTQTKPYLFVNLEPISNGFMTQFTESTEPMLLGAYKYNDIMTGLFTGEIDNIFIYNRTLSSSEILGLYQKKPISTEQLMAKYDFNVVESGNLDSINNTIKRILPTQYKMIIQLKDNNGMTIANAPLPVASSVGNFITAGEKIILVNSSTTVRDILYARYYVWTLQ